MNRWLLPENISDLLPAEARKVENLRRLCLDRFQSYGYELVSPPLLEYLDSLLTGTGQDLNLKTFKLVDQLSGRTLGLRADITPQVARIDAHLLNRSGVTRLCYSGPVLHTLPSLGGSREQLQLGAEIYGYAGLAADLEVQTLLLDILKLSRVGQVTLDLGHAGLVHALMQQSNLDRATLDGVYESLQAKDLSRLKSVLSSVSEAVAKPIYSLIDLSGSPTEVLLKAKSSLPKIPGIQSALDDLATIVKQLESTSDRPVLNLDLADLRGYQYHSGVMFSAYIDGLPTAIARGGRYDEVGQAFGRSRPATGFSLDIIVLARLSQLEATKQAILAPGTEDPKLIEVIRELRAKGEVVIQVLPGQEQDCTEFLCDRELKSSGGTWQVVPRA